MVYCRLPIPVNPATGRLGLEDGIGRVSDHCILMIGKHLHKPPPVIDLSDLNRHISEVTLNKITPHS